ncbi:type 3 dihydrofolate reductase [Catenovulum agarivorans]|uniref:type 3 dihydrofolate reductase n=1 Tax=Catenovulum agarivorans TaxID=1172192 RepID=UPI00036C52DA|nr:type 3 dihydrofolate reductase [Catenovulum agarivorans]
MIISMIAAMTPQRAIGKDNKLLWHLPNDLKFFKQQTLGKPVIMGRKTYDSIGRPLPGRLNIVISRQETSPHPDVQLASSIEQAVEIAKRELTDEQEIVVIGGGHIYQSMLSHADKLYVTIVETEVDADTYFPEIDPQDWQVSEETAGLVDDKNPLAHTFYTYTRR